VLVELQLISYQGQIAAAAGADRFWLAHELESRATGDPEHTFVIYMFASAGLVLRGDLPGPYSDEKARRFAQAALIPDRLLTSPRLDVDRVARAFGTPTRELAAARADP
jgi:hypothetical protein